MQESIGPIQNILKRLVLTNFHSEYLVFETKLEDNWTTYFLNINEKHLGNC